MSERELISAYQHGRMDRRQFIKRLAALGVSTAAAGAYAQVFATRAAEADIRRDEHGFFVTDSVDAAQYGDPTVPSIYPTNPVPGSQITMRRPTISADIYDNGGESADLPGIRKRKVRLRVDNVNIDPSMFTFANPSVGLYKLTYTPGSRLSLGDHVARIDVTDEDGKSAFAVWAFTIAQA
ncbi:MAG: hypothetical protein M3151_14105 [Actinomycetota bacterium]|nr:hypothetical protein [Actinomycetota bacterium]